MEYTANALAVPRVNLTVRKRVKIGFGHRDAQLTRDVFGELGVRPPGNEYQFLFIRCGDLVHGSSFAAGGRLLGVR